MIHAPGGVGHVWFVDPHDGVDDGRALHLMRAVVTDHDIARRILDAIPTAPRAPPWAESTVAYDAAFA